MSQLFCAEFEVRLNRKFLQPHLVLNFSDEGINYLDST